jgi:hypothetical protein
LTPLLSVAPPAGFQVTVPIGGTSPRIVKPASRAWYRNCRRPSGSIVAAGVLFQTAVLIVAGQFDASLATKLLFGAPMLSRDGTTSEQVAVAR